LKKVDTDLKLTSFKTDILSPVLQSLSDSSGSSFDAVTRESVEKQLLRALRSPDKAHQKERLAKIEK